MPPKVKYTKEQITEAAFQLVRRYGKECLTARAVGKELGCSQAPIFTAFENMDALSEEVKKRAWQVYREYIENGMKQSPSFKGTGMAYILMAKEEPELFKLLFMSSTNKSPIHYYPSDNDVAPEILSIIIQNYNISENAARKLYNHLSVYAHGLATLYAEGNMVFSENDIDDLLSEVFVSILIKLRNDT